MRGDRGGLTKTISHPEFPSNVKYWTNFPN
jgi:hypothetical protein